MNERLLFQKVLLPLLLPVFISWGIYGFIIYPYCKKKGYQGTDGWRHERERETCRFYISHAENKILNWAILILYKVIGSIPLILIAIFLIQVWVAVS